MKNKQNQKKNTKTNSGKQIKTNTAKNEKWILVAILAITFIAFYPSLQNGFVNWDDKAYIVDNPVVKDISTSNIKHIFNTSTYVVGNYHPLTVLSYCLEYFFFKLNPFPYHLNNILLHLLNVLLIFIILRRSGIKFQMTVFITLLFAIHPLRVESVTWVAERKDVLYTFFFLCSLLTYLFYIERKQTKTYVLSLILFLCSILSKGQAVVLPLAFFLFDYLLKRDFNRKTILEKVPFIALSLLFGIVALFAQHTSLTAQRLAAHSLFERLLIACYGTLDYLFKLILPLKLACFYPYPDKIDGLFYIAPVALGLLIFIVYKKFKANAHVIFGSLFYLFTISIVSQILPVGDAVIAERYTYIPYIGLFFIMGSGYQYLLEHKQKSKTLINVLAGIYFVWLFYQTNRQTKVWKDSVRLWTSVIERYPETAVAYNNRGAELKDSVKALDDYNNAIKYKQNYFEAYNNRGIVYQNMKKFDLSFADFAKSLEINPGYVSALFNRGLTEVIVGQYEPAAKDYTNAMQYEPSNPQLYYSRAIAYNKLGQRQAAIDDYTKAVEINPNYDDAISNRGNVYYSLGNFDLAIADYNRAIAINPQNPNAFFNKSAAEFSKKDFVAALQDALRARELGHPVDDQYLQILRAGK